MRICVILEGCYPYVTGGVSTWIHQYMKAMPQHEFVVWAVGASSEDRGKFKYELPDNVVEIREISSTTPCLCVLKNRGTSFMRRSFRP